MAQFKKDYNDGIMTELTKMGIEWTFIPPSAPNFGGLWEAGVKSIKYHLKRTIGETKLTYEEFTTVLNQIEACLNSRPVCPLTDNADDLEVLTPGHFLIGESLLLPPEADLTIVPTNRLKRWNLCQKIQQDFWKIWRNEYLNRLQQRTKWISKTRNLEVNNMVLIKDERTTSSKWPLGRITAVHPGKDDLVRVVEVKIGTKIYTRPISKICLLPIKDNFDGGKDDEQKSSSKPAHQSAFSMMTILVFLGLITMITGAQPGFHIQKFEHNPGIYIEEVGISRLTEGNWNLIAYYNLENYFSEYKKIMDGLVKLEKTCFDVDFECTALMLRFSHRLKSIKNRNTILLQNPVKRNKRQAIVAAIGGLVVGGISAYYLSKNEGHQYDEAINKVKQNENHLLNLIRNQTTVFEMTEDAIKRSYQQIQQEFHELNNALDTLSAAHNHSEIAWQLHNTALQLSLMIDAYVDIQNCIINDLMKIHNGKLDPTLINTSNLMAQIKIIQQHIGSYELPGSNSENILMHIYQTADVKLHLNKNKVIFKIMIPLLKPNNYRILRLIPVPLNVNGVHLLLRPAAEYFLVSHDNNTFYSMTKDDIKLCTAEDNEIICKTHHPIFKYGSTYGRCEMEIIREEVSNQTSCIFYITKEDEHWTQLDDLNQWVFGLTKSKAYNISCEETSTTINLKGNGVISLDKSCVLEGNSIHISNFNIQSKLNTGYIPSNNITISTNNSKIYQVHKHGNRYLDLGQLHQSIENTKNQSSIDLIEIDLHNVHHYSIIYVTIILGVSVYIYHCIKNRSKQNKFFVRNPN